MGGNAEWLGCGAGRSLDLPTTTIYQLFLGKLDQAVTLARRWQQQRADLN